MNKVLGTLAIVVIHSLLSLGFIWKTEKKNQSFLFFNNTLFITIVLSFITALFGSDLNVVPLEPLLLYVNPSLK
jgi:sterol desaturase/sphingolipid hydroxylase (fatty acid hydroxylase superfamily)